MTGVTAHARLTAGPGGALPLLRGDGPLALRRTRAEGAYAQVTVVGAMSAPLGGDRLRLTAEVLPGAALRVTSAAATVALPGRSGEGATYDTALTVGAGGSLHWLPEPVISAARSDLRMTTRIDLDGTARLVYREEQVLGRSGEPPGRLVARLVVRIGGVVALDQELAYGPGAPGFDGGAVLGGHRAVGQLLVADPAFADKPAEPLLVGDTAMVTPLAAPAALVTAVAPDALRLRHLLTTASTHVGTLV